MNICRKLVVRLFCIAGALPGASLVSAQAYIYNIDSNGQKLRAYYANLGVGTLWLKGHDINWETGKAEDGPLNKKTHCTSFAAAACKRLDLYTMRPAGYHRRFNGNLMFDWLHTRQARKNGWMPIQSDNLLNIYRNAQRYANEGKVVMVAYKDRSDRQPGHSALVMPATLTDADLISNGPVLIQAGTINSDSVRFSAIFKWQIRTCFEECIVFYVNSKSPF